MSGMSVSPRGRIIHETRRQQAHRELDECADVLQFGPRQWLERVIYWINSDDPKASLRALAMFAGAFEYSPYNARAEEQGGIDTDMEIVIKGVE